ncbi:MAG: DNA replication/repair protein RecF [Bacteroidales bacterium]|nr:DNA replication/repair protein RecF [Bacteroidales bacterium]
MYLAKLKLANFKTYAEANVAFSPGINCLVGNNGMGKTNLLDAIYYLSFCKSCFNPFDAQNITRGSDFFAIHGEYDMDGETTTVACVYKQGGTKQVSFNKKTCSSFAEHIGRIPLVIVSPNDHVLILGGSDVRRKFVDGVISQVDHSYLQTFMHYQKALEQRNTLLKHFYEDRYFDDDAIFIWDEQLTRLAAPIHAARKAFIDELSPLFLDYFARIAQLREEKPELQYVSQLNDGGNMASLLKETHQRDALLQYTSVGIHKDELEFSIGGGPVKKYGSQGQQKTFLLALKLAQYEYIKSHCGRNPILLLDDIFDKLDMLRVRQLIELVGGSSHFGQVFLTDTQPGRVQEIFRATGGIQHKIFLVEQGAIIEENNV